MNGCSVFEPRFTIMDPDQYRCQGPPPGAAEREGGAGVPGCQGDKVPGAWYFQQRGASNYYVATAPWHLAPAPWHLAPCHLGTSAPGTGTVRISSSPTDPSGRSSLVSLQPSLRQIYAPSVLRFKVNSRTLRPGAFLIIARLRVCPRRRYRTIQGKSFFSLSSLSKKDKGLV